MKIISCFKHPNKVPEPEAEHKAPIPKPRPHKQIDTAAAVYIATDAFNAEYFVAQGRTSLVFKCMTVYQEYASMSQKFAFKIVPDADIEEYEAEKHFLGYLVHDNIVKLNHTIVDNIKFRKILCLEYLPNETLYDRLHATRTGFLSWEERMKIALGVARAVDYMHHFKVIHRDIKTTHIVLDKEGNPKLIDFGTAILEPRDKSCSVLKGTEPYQAPEYLDHLTLATYSDMYSLGVVLLELLTGRKLFQDDISLPDWLKTQLPPPARNGNVAPDSPAPNLNVAPDLIDYIIRETVVPEDAKLMMQLAYDCILRHYKNRPNSDAFVSRLLKLSCFTHTASSSSTSTGGN